jgi:autotransporter-associated beta strand protein
MADVTWSLLALSNDYNSASNWMGGGVPGAGDTAFFGLSAETNISVGGSHTQVGAWEFYHYAFRYGFTIGYATELDFAGAGIVDDGGVNTGITINVLNTLEFLNHASAGLAAMTAADTGGEIKFLNHSNAGGAKITNNYVLEFNDESNARNATIDNNSALDFTGTSSAGNAKITTVDFATILFWDLSNGGQAQLITKAGGAVDFSPSRGPGNDHALTVGSIAGGGNYHLGRNQLTIGSNGLSTTASGPIEDGGYSGGSGASLVKVGKGTLKLSHAHNTYSGGTKLKDGGLDIAAVGAAGTGAISFAGTATLKIEKAGFSGHAFDNLIDAFGTHDVIDLAGLTFHKGASATWHAASHHQTVKSASVTDTLTLHSPAGTHFDVAGDGHGGTKVTLDPPITMMIAHDLADHGSASFLVLA